jgi:hypothetical protein
MIVFETLGQRVYPVGAHPPTLCVRQRVSLWDLFTRLYNGQTDWLTGCLVNKRAAYKFQAPIFTPGDYLQRTPFGAPKEVFGKTHKSRRRGYWIPFLVTTSFLFSQTWSGPRG